MLIRNRPLIPIRTLPNGYVLFCFGEIDCRNHVHKHINEDRSYKDIIDDLVCNYFISINKNVKQYKSISL